MSKECFICKAKSSRVRLVRSGLGTNKSGTQYMNLCSKHANALYELEEKHLHNAFMMFIANEIEAFDKVSKTETSASTSAYENARRLSEYISKCKGK